MKKWPLLTVITACIWLADPSPTASTARKDSQLHKLCVLPPQPAHGSYSILGRTAVSTPGDSVDERTLLEINCLPKFVSNSENIVYCSMGKWSAENITCLKTCKPLVSSFFNYDCIFNGVKLSCKDPMPTGAKAYISCNKNYKPVDLPWETIYCMETGEWKHSDVICKPECGTLSTGGKNAINALIARQHEFPWHAAIYDKEITLKPDLPEYICGGSIVSSNKIISVAHCFWDSREHRPRSAEAFAVGYGKEFSDWKNKDDPLAIYTDVKQLIIHPDYRDIELSYAQDIAVLVLSMVIEFDLVVKPICINWSDEREDNTEPGDLGKVPGWGDITEKGNHSLQLMELNVPVVSRRTCRQKSPINFRSYITSDKICAGFGNGSSLCRGDSGGGLIFYDEVKNAFYLKGVVSNGPVHNNQCDSHKYTLFTSIFQFLEWLQDQNVYTDSEVFICINGQRISIEDRCDGIIDCEDHSDESEELCNTVENIETGEVPAGSCILPAKPGNGTYTIYGSDIVSPAWSSTKNGTILKYNCNKKFLLTSGSFVECFEGQWRPSPPECRKPCKSLEQRDGTRLQCKLANIQFVSCYNPLAPGTEVTVSCYSGFTRPNDFVSPLTCNEDSTWSLAAVYCEAECGITYSNYRDAAEIKPAFNNKYGEEYANILKSPWSAYIYENTPGADPVPICRATLVRINDNFVKSDRIITEKSCFTDAQGNLSDPARFAIGMAKLHEGWQDKRDKFAFYTNITGYDTVLDRLDIKQNLTFLKLEDSLPTTILIRPACIYYEADVHLIRYRKVLSLNIRADTVLVLTTIESDEQICFNQNGEGVIYRQYKDTHYLLGILSLDRNKDLMCRNGSFKTIPIHNLRTQL